MFDKKYKKAIRVIDMEMEFYKDMSEVMLKKKDNDDPLNKEFYERSYREYLVKYNSLKDLKSILEGMLGSA